MDLTSGIIDGNHHYLKTCILYEDRIPWNIQISNTGIIRFYHGNRDLDYDRSADPKPKTIMDIPAGSMTKIAEYLDPVERTFLRSMNRTIKAVVDSFPPVFEKIDISVSDTSTRTENAVEDVKRIRDIISTFEELESCELEFHGRWNSIPMREFAEALGEDIPIGPLVQQATIDSSLSNCKNQ
ncbi:unnamed protein product [Caenorhabditis nigoni]